MTLSAMSAIVASATYGRPTVALDSLASVYPTPRHRSRALEALRLLDRAAWLAVVRAAYTVADDGHGASLPRVAELLGYSHARVRAHRAEDGIRELTARRRGPPNNTQETTTTTMTTYQTVTKILRETAPGESNAPARAKIRAAFLNAYNEAFQVGARDHDGVHAALSAARWIAWRGGRGPIKELEALLATVGGPKV